MAINFTPTITELIDMMEDWSEHPATLQAQLIPELQAQFSSMLVNEIESIIDVGINPGLATADQLEAWYITVVSGTTANIETIAKILNHAAASGSATTISNINSAVNAIYGTVVQDQIANDALTHVQAALLTYNSNFATIGNAIGVAPAQQILDDLNGAIADINTLIALL
jgi:hypothetical protein